MSSWIKVQVTLPESPKIFRLARLLGVGRMEALGYAVRWFCWLDTHCAHGATELHADEVDALVGREGVTAAFCAMGWAAVDADGYVLVLEFDKHNGESSKKRAETQGRVAAYRERQRAGSECNAKGVTGALPEGEGEYICSKEGCAGIAELNSAAPAEPARPQNEDDGYGVWLAAVCQAHPSARKSRVLQADVAEAARAAYERCPEASERAELLAAYYAGKQMEDRHRQAFYRPTGQRRFFSDLEDVLCHAERWAKEFGWKPGKKAGKHTGQGKCAETARNGQEGGSEGQQTPMASDEQVMSFLAELRGGGCSGGHSE